MERNARRDATEGKPKIAVLEDRTDNGVGEVEVNISGIDYSAFAGSLENNVLNSYLFRKITDAADIAFAKYWKNKNGKPSIVFSREKQPIINIGREWAEVRATYVVREDRKNKGSEEITSVSIPDYEFYGFGD